MPHYINYIDNEGILGIIRRSCNCVDSRLMDHGFRVSYITSKIIRNLGIFDDKYRRDACILALIHDIGAYKMEEIDQMLKFETMDVWSHSIYGSLFVKYFSPLKKLAPAILYHHTSWAVLKDLDSVDQENKRLAQILNAADRMDVYLAEDGHTWKGFISQLDGWGKRNLTPEVVAALRTLEPQEAIEDAIKKDDQYHHMLDDIKFTEAEIREYLEMLIFTIDFRSNRTVTHTIETATISRELAKRLGLETEEVSKITCGALLHDLGKIGISAGILEHPGKLKPQVMSVMRSHVDITEEILGDGVDPAVKNIALRHHEKVNGTGYPHGLSGEELSLSERIVAVADIISALAGIRSYKEAYPKARIIEIIEKMRDEGCIDAQVVNLMILEFDEIMEHTLVSCRPSLDIYHNIMNEYEEMIKKPLDKS